MSILNRQFFTFHRRGLYYLLHNVAEPDILFFVDDVFWSPASSSPFVLSESLQFTLEEENYHLRQFR